jgi:hypothetical protein
LVGDYAFLSGQDFVTLDVTDMSAPVEVARIPLAPFTQDMVIQGDRAYIVSTVAGLMVVDISTPADPVVMATYEDVRASDVAVWGDRIYVSGASGLVTLRWAGERTYLPLLRLGTDDGLRLALELDEAANADAFADASGWGHDGACAAPGCPTAGVAGMRNTAVSFDGQNDVIQLGNPTALRAIRQRITIAAWVKPEATDGLRNIVAHGYTSEPQGEVFLRVNDGRYEVGAWDGADHLAAFDIPAEDVGSWVHLAGVYDGANWRLYRNGVEVAVTEDETGAVFVYGDWAVGARGDGNGRFFQGSIDDVRIYNRTLFAAEIQALYSN